jgi:hypothetical protein
MEYQWATLTMFQYPRIQIRHVASGIRVPYLKLYQPPQLSEELVPFHHYYPAR